MAEPMPLILDDASIKISKDATTVNLKELACLANHIELAPDVSVTTIDTMCGSRDYPGTVKWSLVATLYQSFDTDATEEILSAAVASDAAVAYEVVGYKSKPIGPTNPAWAGTVIPQPYSPINGDAGEASTVELEWALTAPPAKRTTVTVAAAGLDTKTRTELDEMATAAGLNPADYATKADIVAALEAAPPA